MNMNLQLLFHTFTAHHTHIPDKFCNVPQECNKACTFFAYKMMMMVYQIFIKINFCNCWLKQVSVWHHPFNDLVAERIWIIITGDTIVRQKINSRSVCFNIRPSFRRKTLFLCGTEQSLAFPVESPFCQGFNKYNACLLHSRWTSEGPVIPLHWVSPLSTVISLPVTFHLLSLGCRQERVKPAPSLWSGHASRMPREQPDGGC